MSGQGWRGDSDAHAIAGRLGGKKQSRHKNPNNFANNKKAAADAGRKGMQARWKKENRIKSKDLIPDWKKIK